MPPLADPCPGTRVLERATSSRQTCPQSAVSPVRGVGRRCPTLRVRKRAAARLPRHPIGADPPDWRHLHERSPRSRGRQWASLGDRPHIGLLVKGGSVGRARLSVVAIANRRLRCADQRASCSRQSRAANATATRRDRIAPSLVTLRSHPSVNGRRFKPSTGPHILLPPDCGRHGPVRRVVRL
jgi:hypothetical protein